MSEAKINRQRPHLRLVRGSIAQRPIARVDLNRPGALEALQAVASDFLFEHCSDEGRRKLLAEHELLAA